MDTVAFDALTRRASLLSLGVAGLTAAVSGPLAAGAKNKNKKAKKKLKKKQKQKCQSQVEPCEAVLTANCEDTNQGDPDGLAECLATQPPCCESLGTCDVEGFFTCLIAA
jgi:hypothetical protein